MKNCTIINIDRCSLNDGPGIRTVIFFKGCNLRCSWCHNPESYNFGIQNYIENNQEKQFGYEISLKKIKEIIIKDREYYEASNGGITLSGGEALLQLEAVIQILKFCKQKNINTCIETSGYVPLKNIQSVEKYVDLWLYDYKLSDQKRYFKYIKAKPELIYKNLEYLIKNNNKIILRCPIIPTINDNEEHFKMIAKISNYVTAVEILPYHNLGKEKAQKLNLKEYFIQNNPTEELKRKWQEQLESYHCIDFTIK